MTLEELRRRWTVCAVRYKINGWSDDIIRQYEQYLFVDHPMNTDWKWLLRHHERLSLEKGTNP